MRLLEHPRFRAAYDFLALRSESGEVAHELVDWWTRFQTATDDERQAMLKPDEAPKKRRRPRSRRKRAEPAADAVPPSAEE
jgi:poly(A) polymerase